GRACGLADQRRSGESGCPRIARGVGARHASPSCGGRRMRRPYRMGLAALADPLNAFCSHSTARLQGARAGPLAGLTFAAKDLFDIEGHVTGAGNPDWLALHAPASRTAPVVQRLIVNGADMIGKTHTDEVSRGILGENVHYGTPVNPK